MLDTVIQATPLALVLTNDADAVLYSNSSARRLFAEGRKLEGDRFARYLERAPGPLREAIERGGDTLFTLEIGGEPEVYHVSQRSFLLNSVPHRLLLLKQLTREINSQEVATWKKVIRVIAHELNNSLAPISSLAHSGQILANAPPNPEQLLRVFSTIEDRARHLAGFIEGYAQFAKLPQPRLAPVDWGILIERLRAVTSFQLVDSVPKRAASFDTRADRAGVDQSPQECARIRRRSRLHRARREPRRAGLQHRSPRSRTRLLGHGAGKRAGAVLFHQGRVARDSDSRCAGRSSKRTAGACASPIVRAAGPWSLSGCRTVVS